MSLLTHPLYTADTLGMSLPPGEFGVSVSLPLWEHVIGYEEKDERVVSKFRSGYPRFFLPPLIEEFNRAAESEVAQPGERCLSFPRIAHAQRCLAWLAAHGKKARVCEHRGLGVCIFAAESYDEARRFWRFAGEVISARQAQHAMGRGEAVSRPDGDTASRIVRERIANLTGQHVEDVFLFPSGMAATFTIHRMLCDLFPKQRTVQFGFPYVDVLKVQQFFGIGVEFLPTFGGESYARLGEVAKAGKIAGLFTEAPTNPLLQCADPDRLRALIGETPLIIDDTIGTCVHVDAFRHADAVTTSLTKTFSGAGDVLAGSIVLNRASPHHAAFSAWMREHCDHALFAADAVALEKNSRGFVERAQAMSRNSLGLYEHFIRHPAIDRVWHSANEGGPGYAKLQRTADGHGCLFSITLKDAARTPAFYDALRVCKGPSLGTDFTLVCPYTLLAHYDELDWAESCGVPRHLIRISAGIEPLEDLKSRFDEALK